MNKESFFENYLSSVYGCLDMYQIEDKSAQFEYNYSKYFPADKNSRILEIGPGCGSMLLLWRRLGFKNYTAVDVSPQVIDFCRKKGLEVMLIKNLQDFLKDNQERFDFISMLEVIEHIDKDEILNTFTLLKNSLKPKGRVIIETPNMGAVFGTLLRYHDFTHNVGFVSHSLLQLVITAGFEEVEIRGFEGIYRRDLRSMVRKFLRNYCLYPAIRITRKINDSDLTDILSPYIYVTAVR